MPEIESVMYNYMKCSQLVFGRKLKYCVTFKINQKGIDIYRRQYEHTFKGLINNEDFNNSSVIESKKLGSILISRKDKIMVYDSTDYTLRMNIPI